MAAKYEIKYKVQGKEYVMRCDDYDVEQIEHWVQVRFLENPKSGPYACLDPTDGRLQIDDLVEVYEQPAQVVMRGRGSRAIRKLSDPQGAITALYKRCPV